MRKLNDIDFDDLEGDPELDKYLYKLMEVFWYDDLHYGIFMHCEVDIPDAAIWRHWFDSVKNLNDHKKDMISKLTLEELPDRIINSLCLILNNIISMMNTIIQIAKYNYTMGSNAQRITTEYGERFIDLVYLFYYTHLITRRFVNVIKFFSPGKTEMDYLSAVVSWNLDENGKPFYGDTKEEISKRKYNWDYPLDFIPDF